MLAHYLTALYSSVLRNVLCSTVYRSPLLIGSQNAHVVTQFVWQSIGEGGTEEGTD